MVSHYVPLYVGLVMIIRMRSILRTWNARGRALHAVQFTRVRFYSGRDRLQRTELGATI
jgi:hypothetical protein